MIRLAAVLALVVAPTSAAQPTPVDGDPAALGLVAGEWAGGCASAVVLMTPRVTDPDPAPVPLVGPHIEVAGESFGDTLTDDGRPESELRAAGFQVDAIPQAGQWGATRVADWPLTDR